MAVKKVLIPNIGEVSIFKRKGAKVMRISISHSGEIRLSMPKWAPYSAGVAFVANHRKWIDEHSINNSLIFEEGSRIGKAHTLNFIVSKNSSKISSRVNTNQTLIYLPEKFAITSEAVQKTAKLAAIKSLKVEAEKLLPQRLKLLADQYGFEYSKVSIKQLKSRWGSCNNLKEITLNLYLMQLPWSLIDYVILHELTHTKVLAHGKDFWDVLNKYLPDAKQLKKEINTHKPIITLNT